jgi:oligopeptide transport system permease protein
MASRGGYWGEAWSRLLQHRAAVLSLAVLCVIGVMAALAPWIDRPEPAGFDAARSFQSPSWEFWLGTDQLGRDQYSRLLHGARVSLAVALLSQLIAVALGVTVGLIAGLGNRHVDNTLMRITDMAYAFPDLLTIIVLVGAFGRNLGMVVLAIGLLSWMTIARLVRGQVLSLREEEYVLAARAMGASGWRIAWRHLLPNLTGPVIVAVTFGIPAAIFAEAALAYLGLGLSEASWGKLVNDSFSSLYVAPHLAISSCLAIAITMMSFSFLGDGLRDAFDPRARRQPRSAEALEVEVTNAQPEADRLPERKAA